MINRTTNIIINEIMSGKNSSSIVLTKSDGEHIGFLSALVNNYKKAIWFNCSYDIKTFFSIDLAKKIMGNDSYFNRIKQYTYCKTDFSKEILIISATLSYVEKLNYDLLLIIDHLESLPLNFKMEVLEALLLKCPRNLKVVLVSSKFPDINFNIFLAHSPKLIGKELLDQIPNKSESIQEDFTEEQWSFLSDIAALETVEGRFADILMKDGSHFLNELSRKYNSLIYKSEENMYYINTKLDAVLRQLGNKRMCDTARLKEKLFNFYCSKEVGNYYLAFMIATKEDKSYLMDKVVKVFLEDKKELKLLENFIYQNPNINLSEPEEDHLYARFFFILKNIIHKNYNIALQNLKGIYDKVEETSYEQVYTLILAIKIMYGTGNKKEAAYRLLNYIEESIDKYGGDILHKIAELVSIAPFYFNNSNLMITGTQYGNLSAYMLDEKFKNYYWYLCVTEAAISFNLDLGHYKRAIGQLKSIQEYLPFYLVPHEVLMAYFYAGDMELAKKVANDIIYTSKWYGVIDNITEAYVLLGLVSVYYNKINEALEYLNEAVKYKNVDESAMYNAILIRALICAEIGMTEYAKDIILLYARRCEIKESKYAPLMYGVASYIYWVLRDKENSFLYAKKCVLNSYNSRSGYWLIATAVMISHIFENEDKKSAKQLVEKFFAASKNYGMEQLFLVCNRLFTPILEYAIANNIESDYTKLITARINHQKIVAYSASSMHIKFMGNTGIFVAGKELIWKTKKAKELFLLYVLRGNEGIDRNEIIDLFWGDYVYVSALNNLKTTNNLIRNTLHANQIEFKLNYTNSKYTLYLKEKETDYDMFKDLADEINSERDLRKRAILITKIMNIYGSGFACDIRIKYFGDIRDKLKEELSLIIAKHINELNKSMEYVDAKRYISIFKKINGNSDYSYLLSENEKKGSGDENK